MELIQARIIENALIAPEIYSMSLHTPGVAQSVKPGKFTMVYLNRGELLLPRPISICDADGDVIRLVYHVVGAGTKVMADMEPGENLKILAPLGNGFFLDNAHAGKNFALIGGGIGSPPLLMLAKVLAGKGAKIDVFLGFRSNPILVDEFESVANEVFVSTEDGSFGHHGRILDLLEGKNYDEFFSCGPLPMLRALKDYSLSVDIPCQVSLEERMGCGIGTCVGCVVEIEGQYVKICSKGPVFYSSEVSL